MAQWLKKKNKKKTGGIIKKWKKIKLLYKRIESLSQWKNALYNQWCNISEYLFLGVNTHGISFSTEHNCAKHLYRY